MNGLIDSVLVSKRVLDPGEKSWLYNAGLGRRYDEADAGFKVSLVSWWDMEGTGDEPDKHGTNHLTASASAPTRVPGLI